MSLHQYTSLSDRQMRAMGLHEVIPGHEAFGDLEDTEANAGQETRDGLLAEDVAGLRALVAEHTD